MLSRNDRLWKGDSKTILVRKEWFKSNQVCLKPHVDVALNEFRHTEQWILKGFFLILFVDSLY